MEVSIIDIAQKHYVGMSCNMSFADDRTAQLWGGFRPRVAEIGERVGEDFTSLQIYPQALDFSNFNPRAEFTKWALVEVTRTDDLPPGMEAFNLDAGRYAKFKHRGPAAAFAGTMQAIFAQWLPQSGYHLDTRPHFEVLGPNYSPTDPGAEEDIWIPIRQDEPELTSR